MRILVTGSRDWADEQAIREELEPYVGTGAILVHGACPTGADEIARRYWTGLGLPEEAHPADWSLGRSGGPTRNVAMVAAGADVCLAFIGPCSSPRCNIEGPHSSHGATGCADLAEQASIHTRRRYTP